MESGFDSVAADLGWWRNKDMTTRPLFVLSLACAMLACGGSTPAPAVTAETLQAAAKLAEVNTARILAADSEPGSWLSTGRTYREQR